MIELLCFLAGLAVGVAAAVVVFVLRRRGAEDAARQVLERAQAERLGDIERMIDRIRDVFGNLSRDALAGNSAQFLQLAQTHLAQQTSAGEAALESRKKLIDANLEVLQKKLGELSVSVQTVERERRESFGKLLVQLETTGQITARLQSTTTQLTEVLSSSARRGQWGERMAEDVLRFVGLVEGVNYRKQESTVDGKRPDYVFFLPHGPRVNMDVKFPLSNYVKYVGAEGAAAEGHCKAFLNDVRGRIREVTTREYVDPAGGTVDFVLVFIPNERIYGFIHESDPDMLDFALSRKVVLCSPLTLFAILAVIRQATDTFRVHETSHEIISLLQDFRKQWDKYGEVVAALGKALEKAAAAYQDLTTTRSRALERQMDKIEALRQQRLAEESTVPDTPDARE